MSQTPFVAINSCNDLSEAYIIKGLLEQNDIPAIIEDTSMGSIYPGAGSFGAIRIKVHQDHVQSAHALMGNVEPISHDRSTRPQNSANECPACGSPEVFKYKSFLRWIFGKSRPDLDGNFRRCVSCDHRWRDGDRKDNMMLLALVLGACAYIAVWILMWVIDFLRYL